ncbi:N-acetylglucosamine kinase [Danxiaibacter flavus]|uniref:N-acetylglucosamine kinase n=1 Tax=Danxiaibacter flavus TaxID=3049108 RepID=A0ABV3ZMX2_9BACT|nr:N-acetylglucosamine kinase [Chitinophagaceae bacterium DXS]
MILVADSGSTKTNWCLISAEHKKYYFDTEGYNPYFVNPQYITGSLLPCLPQSLDPQKVTSIYFYGAGCFDEKLHIINTALSGIFTNASIHAGLDLLGSAKALLGDKQGFIAILGTGTNSCLYDGTKITANIDSLGYLLGDEGSGFYIGRKILSDYVREYMPLPVREEFFTTYVLTRETIMELVYSEKLPNRFCAQFTKFISTSIADKTYTHDLIKSAFTDFFANLVARYENYQHYTFNCTGSIGYTFKDILTETAEAFGMQAGTIIKRPIEGLADYHAQQLFSAIPVCPQAS